MRVEVLVVLTVLTVSFVNAARRRVRSTTGTTVTTTMTTPASFIGRQLGFAGQPEELETLWDNYDIQKLDNRAESWKSLNNVSEKHDEVVLNTGRQFYPGLPTNPGETNELPKPISPQPTLLPHPPGCLGPRGQYPSPKSCANYLNCWDDVVIEQTCPAGLLFNDVTNVCDFDYNVNCGNRPPATPKPPLPPGSKLCPDPNGRYRSSTNCSEFYVCVGGRPVKFACPRSLVYNDILNVCDYPYNVDCRGAATPKPQPPPQPPTIPPQTPSHPPPTSKPSTKPPTYPPQPTYPSQPPTYPSPQLPTYQPQPYPPPAYPGNPWLTKVEPDPWHQRPSASQLEIDNERLKNEEMTNGQPLDNQPQDVMETSSLMSPWNLFQVIPPELMSTPCKNGDVHRLNESCTNMVVCRNDRPQMVRCSSGFSYDKPSDSCKPFSVAKC
ncbi:WAS/WASL-interacting protein family member 3 [Harpegnathos saltator]|uniref:WAS/WASL-interacting protein family member 3 n=1 Tax=Harpegnathos saltator TaxID=610380 RepID=UPI00058C9D24|nr:WAS/WASL-interacting protein family member 3 [Harpegnathos saltator]